MSATRWSLEGGDAWELGWRVDCDGTGGSSHYTIWEVGRKHPVAFVVSPSAWGDDQNRAHLIAAAPELLEAAKAMVDAEDALLAQLKSEGRHVDLTQQPYPLMSAIRAAIAKAQSGEA
jgi:hypothetical protein